MSSKLIEIFNDGKLIDKIKNRLPHLFQLAEMESSRAGKIGMEVGSLREKIITALLIYKFGKENVETEIPITEPEIDAKLLESQRKLFDRMGRQNYIQLPKPGTNPRGAEITKEALSSLVKDKDAKTIEILWKKTTIEFNPYKRWVDYWKED